MAAINQIQRRQEPSEDEKLLQVIMTGLKVADTVYGIKDAGAKREIMEKELMSKNKQLENDSLRYKAQESRDQQNLDINRQKLELEKVKAGKEANNTKGREEADKTFAKDYSEWNAGGGYAGVQKQLNALEGAAKTLESQDGANFTGPGGGLASAIGIRAYTNPKAEALKQSVEQAVQNSLRATLGSQFTEKEGARIMKNSYDDRLSPAQNVAKIRATIQELDSIAQSKDAASRYFEQHGTLTGFNPAQKRDQMTAQKGTAGPSQVAAGAPQPQFSLEELMQEKIRRQGIGGGIKGR